MCEWRWAFLNLLCWFSLYSDWRKKYNCEKQIWLQHFKFTTWDKYTCFFFANREYDSPDLELSAALNCPPEYWIFISPTSFNLLLHIFPYLLFIKNSIIDNDMNLIQLLLANSQVVCPYCLQFVNLLSLYWWRYKYFIYPVAML